MLEGGRVSLGAQNRSQEAPNEPKTSHNAPKDIFGSKTRANEAQESSETILEAFFCRSRGSKELPRNPQELPKGARESPQTLSKPYLDRQRWILKHMATSANDSLYTYY